jgi:soluble lytic murein transglycosylase-like protein
MRRSLPRLLAVGTLAATALVFTAQRVKPVYIERSIGARLSLLSATADEKLMRENPWSRLSFHDALGTPTFLRDRHAFALDLVATGKVSFPRAIRLADVAVREAYRRQVPPALVLGVLLTENTELKSTARSRQGALGLMQIHPGPWRPALGALFGRNLRNDTTNLRYGVYILSHLARRSIDTPEAEQWRTALLRYNGCVRGTNTPDCKRYPDVVRRKVLSKAKTTCAGKDFESCVVGPLRIISRAAPSSSKSS